MCWQTNVSGWSPCSSHCTRGFPWDSDMGASPAFGEPRLQACSNGLKVVMRRIEAEVCLDLIAKVVGDIALAGVSFEEPQQGAGEAFIFVARPVGKAHDSDGIPLVEEIPHLRPALARLALRE